MTERNSLHYCYDVSYQCWFTSEEAKIYCYNFNSSNAVLSNSCVLCTTRCNKCGRIGTKWLFFFTFIEECCVVIEKNIDKKLANRISHQIWYKRCLKGKFGRGSKSAKGGPYPPTDLDWGVKNPRGVQIRCDTGIPGKKSGLKYPKPLQSLLSMNQVNSH